MDATDWRTQLQPDSRHRIVTKIMETLNRRLPISSPEGLEQLRNVAARFEERMFTVATSQSDYLRKISLKMLTMEMHSQTNGVANSLPLNTAVGSKNPQDPPSDSMQSQVRNPEQSQILLANQSLAQQHLLSQNVRNNIANPRVQGPMALSRIAANQSNVEPNMEATDWRTQLPPGSRQRVVAKIVETLKRHLPLAGNGVAELSGAVELNKIAVRFEEKVFTAATSQSDYLRKISLKMLTMETKSTTATASRQIPQNAEIIDLDYACPDT